MNALTCLLIIVALIVSPLAHAVCPVQETTVFYVNGVDTKESDAQKSMDRLREELKKDPRFRSDCVSFDYAYNSNELLFLDLLESGLQKAEEITGESNFFWKQYFRVIPTSDWFDDLVVDALFIPISGAIGLGEYFLGDQTDEHVAEYRKEIGAPPVGKGRRVVLAGHSQGSGMAVLERGKLSASERPSVFVVAASALIVPEPEPERYTTLDHDNLATGIFADLGAPPANVSLTSALICSDVSPSPWYCHAFKEVYLTLPETKEKIVNDIVAALPAPTQDTLPPSVPTGLTGVVAVSLSQINLSWNASMDNVGVTGYDVKRCTGTGCSPSTIVASPTNASLDDTGLSPNTFYRYSVRAKDAAGNISGFSSVTTVATIDTTPPTTPGTPIASNITSNSLTLNWTAAIDNIAVTGYRLERCTGASCTSFIQIAAPTTNSYSDTNLSLLTTYRYRVRSADAAGNTSLYSPIGSATTEVSGICDPTPDTSPPSTPGTPIASNITSNSLTLNWTAAIDNNCVIGYRLERCTGANCFSFVQIAPPTANTYNDTALSPLTTYRYRVRSADGAGNTSAYSPIGSATTLGEIAEVPP